MEKISTENAIEFPSKESHAHMPDFLWDKVRSVIVDTSVAADMRLPGKRTGKEHSEMMKRVVETIDLFLNPTE